MWGIRKPLRPRMPSRHNQMTCQSCVSSSDDDWQLLRPLRVGDRSKEFAKASMIALLSMDRQEGLRGCIQPLPWRPAYRAALMTHVAKRPCRLQEHQG